MNHANRRCNNNEKIASQKIKEYSRLDHIGILEQKDNQEYDKEMLHRGC